MSDRSPKLLQIRPQVLSAAISTSTCSEERFQNLTLRPIIKFQNPLLVAALHNYIGKHKNHFYELSLEKRLSYIENAVQRDIKFRNSLKGMIIGLFTVEEYERYMQGSSSLNKRMMNMVIARYKDQIQLFDHSLVQ